MTFLNPILATLGLLAVSLPILIHILMRRRRKPIAWAAMRFLLEAYQQQRRRLRFEQWLLLAARCLLVALIALAIGRPILGAITGASSSTGPTTLILLLDNSLASGARDNPVDPATSALARHKARARQLLDRLEGSAGDRAALITLAGPAEARVLPPTSDLSALRDLIDTLEPLDAPADLAGALTVVKDLTTARTPATLAILSDLRQGSLDVSLASPPAAPAKPDSPITLLATPPAESPLTNTTITALEPLRPLVILPARASGAGGGQSLNQAPVRVSLRRSGDLPATNITLRLAFLPAGDSTRAIPAGSATVRFAAGQPEAAATLVLDAAALAQQSAAALASTSAILQATLDDPADALPADNTFRRPIELRQSLRVGLIATRSATPDRLDRLQPADWFRLALQAADAEIEIVELDPAAVDAPRLAALDAAICPQPDALTDDAWRRLRALVDAGGLVLLSPPPTATVHTWPDQLARALSIPWQLPREAEAITATLAPRRAIEPQRDLLALIAPELEDLARPITIAKLLAPSTAPSADALLLTDTGRPILLAAAPTTPANEPAAAGLVVLLTVAPSFEWTNLQAKPLMVPLVQELIRQGVARARPTRLALAGQVPSIPARTTDLRTPTNTTVALNTPVRTATTLRALDERGGLRGLIALNPDPAAARLDPQPREALAKALAAATDLEPRWLESTTATTRAASKDTLRAAHNTGASRLILGLILAALALAIVDAILSRWFTHATPRSTSGGPA